MDCVRIIDEPRFGWRGVHLDVCRHFMPLADLFRFVDLAALHKYNVFHLHLTDDQGWRFASDRYPKLQERASWRSETQRHLQDFADGTPHGGFYTHDQLRSLVRYAADRGITVMPELEFPGHVLALLAAYPELGNHPETGYQPATTFGVFPEVLNLSDEAMTVVFDLYEELLEVFDSPYVHVGGDECPREEWIASPAARALAERRGLPAGVPAAVVHRAAPGLARRPRSPAGRLGRDQRRRSARGRRRHGVAGRRRTGSRPPTPVWM